MESLRSRNKKNSRRTTPRHITIKITNIKDKERTLKSERRKIPYKRSHIRISAKVSAKLYRPEGIGMTYLMY